jgi:hypothetical protein
MRLSAARMDKGCAQRGFWLLQFDALLTMVAWRCRAGVGAYGDRMSMTDDRQERIRSRAHRIWIEEGQPAGQHERHWQQAVADVDREDAADQPSSGRKSAKKTAGKAKSAAKEEKASTKASKAKTEKPKKSAK